MAPARTFRPGRFLWLAAAAILGCNAIAGIGAPTLDAPDGGTPAPASESGAPASDAGDQAHDGAAPTADASDDAPVDASIPDTNVPDTNAPDTFTPPPPAAKPGFDLTAGGTFGRSASFALVGVVGESPGGNNVGKSSRYVLKAGVIAVTQPN